jgi:RimJ/RimL family protein N-acetyltransferase
MEHERVTLRGLRPHDAASLCTTLATPDVAHFISPPPTTIRGFERFIEWMVAEQAAGRCACFAIVPPGNDVAAGLIQVRRFDSGSATAEWGFAIAAPYWGDGTFPIAAELVVDFVFDVMGVHRLEARATVTNGRGNGVLRKLGARQEAILYRSFLRDGHYVNQVLWSITADEWRARR